MNGVLQAAIVLLALCVLGAVGLQLSGGSNRAASDSARCLDPRQPGCEAGGQGATAGLRSAAGQDWKRPGALQAPRPRERASGQAFELPQSAPVRVEAAQLGAGASAGGSGAALQTALQDLLRELPPDLRQRTSRGAPGDPDASIIEYIDRVGEVLFRVASGRGGIFATDYDKGLAYELERDGSLRREGALADPAESAARRAGRLQRRWGADRADAAALAGDAAGAAAYIDLRRAGLRPGDAARLARQGSAGLPPYPAWAASAQGELGAVDEGVARAFYAFLSEVPFLSRLAAAALGEPPLEVARRFGFQGHLLRSFMEGATTDDLLLGSRLPPGALPQRVRPDGPPAQRTLRALVGDAQRAALLPLCAASLQEALERPAEVLAEAGLPAAYPYLLLYEEDGPAGQEGQGALARRPLLVSAATLRSWAQPVQPGGPDALERLGALAADAPVALEAPLPAAALAPLGLPPEAAAPPQLRAYALAGPLRELLDSERRPVQRLYRLLDGPAGQPPARYFGHAPFLYSSVRAGAQVLGRSGIPTGELLRLQAEQAGLRALPGTWPEGAGARLGGAFGALLTAYQRASASAQRLRGALLTSAEGRQVTERFDLVEAQLALLGLAAGCQAGGRCPLPGLRTPEDGALQLTALRRSVAALRPRAAASTLPRADAAELGERLGELLLALDGVAAALDPQRPFRPRAQGAEALGRMAAYIEAATGEAPRPDGSAGAGAFLVRDLDAAPYREHLAAWERGEAPTAATEAEALALRRDRGELPGTLGELVQRYGAALQAAPLEHLAPGAAKARPTRRVRQRLRAGLQRVSIVQTLDGAGALRDVEVLIERPGGALDGVSYGPDGRLRTAPGPGDAGAAVSGAACLRCHRDGKGAPLLSPAAPWQKGPGGVTWLTPVAAAELARSAAASRAADLR